MSRKIPLQNLDNTRDLGGTKTADGRTIADGMLIRSGHLHDAGADDIAYLTGHVGLIVDFRTENERAGKPDPDIPGTEYLHLPIIESLAAGISRDIESDEDAFTMVAGDPDKARQYMMNTYLIFVTNKYSISQYRRFVDLLLQEREKAVLWHCTAGKDRAGFASVIVQELLGVTRNDIMEDYLQTNVYLKKEIEQLMSMIGCQMGGLTEKAERALKYLFGAHEEYVAGIYKKTEEIYGSFDAFLENALLVSPEERKAMQERYLIK